MDWEAINCGRCKKAAPAEELPTCDIEYALGEALIDDGTVSEDIAERMGHLKNRGRYGWPCGEVEWTEEWKAEWKAMQNESA